MMSKQNVPELRFPEFSGEWEIDTFNEIFDFYNNKRVPLEKGERKLGPYPYYGATGIIDYIDDYIFEGEYLLIGEDGANIVSRNAKLVYFATGKFWVNNHAHILKPKMGDNYFFYNALERINYVKYNSGTAQPKLNHGTIKKIKVSYPQIEEQNKIGNFLSKLDRLIELEEKKLELLEEQKKGYMQKIFSQELRFKDENGNDYPEWEEKKMKDLFNNIGGIALEKEYQNEGKLKVISIGSYSSNNQYIDQGLRVDDQGKASTKKLNAGDLTMVLNDKTKDGGIIGRCLYINDNNTYVYNQRTERLIPKNDHINSKFMWIYLNTEKNRKKILQLSQGGTQIYVNYSSVKNITYKIPSIDEQNKITSYLMSLIDMYNKKKCKLAKYYSLKESLFKKLFI